MQPGLAPGERLAMLRSLRERINTLLGEADTYIGDVELLREAEFLTIAEAVLKVRQNATIRADLIARGMATPEDLDAAGYLSHEDLDHLREEGRLIESVEAILAFADEQTRLEEGIFDTFKAKVQSTFGVGDLIHFDPDKHPRDRNGKFRKTLGGVSVGGTSKLPSGVEVKRHAGGFTVHHPDGTSSAHTDAQSAADAAIGHHDVIAAKTAADNAPPPPKPVMPPKPGGGKIHLPPKGRRGAMPEVIVRHPPKTTEGVKESPYFNLDKAALTEKYGDVEVRDVPLSEIIATRARETGIANARKLMDAAARGEGEKRDPITLVPSEGGGYKVHDGNSTFAVAKELGLQSVPAIIARDEKHAAEIESKAKAAKAAGDGEVVRTSDPAAAVEALLAGKNVELDQPHQVSTMLDKLHEVVSEMEAKGEKAPNADLCRVTVKGTSLFCVSHVDVPRILMPQLLGVPTPGTASAELGRNQWDEVDLTQDFIAMLKARGVEVTEDEELTANLKASQRELDGKKVAEITKRIKAGKQKAARNLVVTKDNYIVDGHHTWAGTVAADYEDGQADMRTPVTRIDMPILDLLAEANGYAAVQGLKPASVPGSDTDTLGRTLPTEVASALRGMVKPEERDLTGKVQHTVADPDELYATADKLFDSYRAVLDLGQGISEDINAQTHFIDSGAAFEAAKAAIGENPDQPHVVVASMKGRDVAAKKVEAKFDGDWSRLTDVMRGTVLVPHPADVPVVMEALRKNGEARGWKISQVQNRMMQDGDPGPTAAGYSDISLLIEHDGFHAEVQINTTSMWAAKEIDVGHKLYEQERDIERDAAIEKRPLTTDEESRLLKLRFQAKLLYLKAWERSLKASRIDPAAAPLAA